MSDRVTTTLAWLRSSERNRYFATLAAFALAQVILIWVLPVLPAQDLPQHLAYARILADYNRPELPFHELYELPRHMQPYFLSHYVLAWLGRVMPVDSAARIVLSFYAIGLLASVHLLASAVHRPQGTDAPPPWHALAGALLIWNPALVMGFLPFALALPPVLCGCALLISTCERQEAGISLPLLACGALVASIHSVAAGCLALLTFAYVIVAPSWRRVSVGSELLITMTATHVLWSTLGDAGLGSFHGLNWEDAIRTANGLEFLNLALRVQWHDPIVKLGYLLWTILGPFRLPGLAFIALGFAAVGLIVARAHRLARPAEAPAPRTRRFRRAVLVFFVASWLTPWGFYVPSEITFLDFRLFTIAALISVAALPAEPFRQALPRRALVVLGIVWLAHFGYRSAQFAREARPVQQLLAQAKPPGPMLPLVFSGKSAAFAKQFRLMHFLPMYYTAIHGGTSAQFWAQYTHHLPVGYRRGKGLKGPPDWRPQELRPAHLDGFDFVLLESAAPDDPAAIQRASASAEALIVDKGRRIACADRWCLYRAVH